MQIIGKRGFIALIIVVVIVVVLGTVAYFTYNKQGYFQNKKNGEILQQKSGSGQNDRKTQKDCGIGEIDVNTALDESDFEKNATLVCLGQGIADNCANARAILKGSSEALIEVSGTDFDSCRIKETVIKDSANPQYTNKYMECPAEKLLADFLSGKKPSAAEILKIPGTYAAWVLIGLNFSFLDTNQATEDLGCVTNLN